MIHIKEIGEVMSTWSKATYEMVADVMAMFAYPMAGSGCPVSLSNDLPDLPELSVEEWSDIHSNQLAHQYDNMVVKFVQVFMADNPNFSPARFKETIQEKAGDYFEAYEELNLSPEYREQAIGLSHMLQDGNGSDESFFLFVSTLERLIREIVASHRPLDDR